MINAVDFFHDVRHLDPYGPTFRIRYRSLGRKVLVAFTCYDKRSFRFWIYDQLLVTPSLLPRVAALLEAAQWNFATTLIPLLYASVSMGPHQSVSKTAHIQKNHAVWL
jgi:hypothetical protein